MQFSNVHYATNNGQLKMTEANGMITHLGEGGAAFFVLPQTWRLQALEDGGEGTAGTVSPRAGVGARHRHAAPYRQVNEHDMSAEALPLQASDGSSTKAKQKEKR